MSFDNLDTTPSVEDLQKQLADMQAQLAAANAPTKAKAKRKTPAEVDAEGDTPLTPEAEQIVHEAERMPAVQAGAPEAMPPSTENALVLAQASTFLACLPDAGDTMGALEAALEADDSRGGTHLYPILTQANGVTGGAFERARHMSDDEAGNLPEGRKPFTGVFLGYRFIGTSWPKGYDANNTGSKQKPVFSVALPATERDLVSKLMTISKNYQYYTGDRAAFDYDPQGTGGPGHIRPQLEMLVFDPDGSELIVVQTCSHYNSCVDTRDQLVRNATTLPLGEGETKPRKAMLPFVGRFSPKTTKATTKKGREVVHHWVQIDKMDVADATARAAWDSWQKFSETARQDQSIMDRVNDWFAGKDAPVSTTAKQALLDGDAIS